MVSSRDYSLFYSIQLVKNKDFKRYVKDKLSLPPFCAEKVADRNEEGKTFVMKKIKIFFAR